MIDEGEDDDFVARQESARKAEARAQADREANEAVRKAAEADEERIKAEKEAAAKKGGWFTGIWGKKDPNAPVTHKAKLGEERKLVYDEKLKRWVNKDGSTLSESPSATPPPPRGPGSRASSAAASPAMPPSGPPSGPPSRVVSGAPPSSLPGSRPATAGSVTSPMSAGLPSSGPPSRTMTPATGDAPPAANGMNGMQPPSRPPTSMSQANSIDDLLGAPQARKGGTVKGKKKGGRYVDVMAK